MAKIFNKNNPADDQKLFIRYNLLSIPTFIQLNEPKLPTTKHIATF